MEIETICPNCKRIYTLDSQYEGSEAECESCHATFTVARKVAKSSNTYTYKAPPLQGRSREILHSSMERAPRISQNFEDPRSLGSIILILVTGIKILLCLVDFIKICDTNVPAILGLGCILDLLWFISFFVFVIKSK